MFWLAFTSELENVGQLHSKALGSEKDSQSCPSASFQYPLGFINSLLAGSLQHRDYQPPDTPLPRGSMFAQ